MSERSILPRLIASLVGLIVAVSLVLAGALMSVERARRDRDLRDAAAFAARHLARSLAFPAWNVVEREIDSQLEAAMLDPALYGIVFAAPDLVPPVRAWTRDGAWKAVGGMPDEAAKGLIVETGEIVHEGQAIAELKLFYTDRAELDKLGREAAVIAALILGEASALALGLLLILRSSVMHPLRSIERWASMVSLGERAPLPAGSAKGEIESLRDSIARMVLLLEERYRSKLAREREYRSLFESTPIATWELDFSAFKTEPREAADAIRIRAANAAALRSLCLAAPSDRIVDVLGGSDEASAILADEARALASGAAGARGEVAIDSAERGRRVFDIGFAVLSGHEDDWSRVIMTASDMTDRVAAEDGLKLALRDKEALVQELFHRTRNNLQMMDSYISLRQDRASDAGCEAEFRELARRIRTLAMAQDGLIRSGDLSRIDLGAYLRDVVETVVADASGGGGRLRALVDAEPIRALIDAAVPVGLIATELALNSAQHAFPEGRRGVIEAALKRLEDGTISVSVGDDGVGPPPGFDPRRDASLGLESVIALAEGQLKGSISFDLTAGFRCEVRFSDEYFEQRV